MQWRKNNLSVISIKWMSILVEMACTEVSTVLSVMFPPNDAVFAQYQVVTLTRIWFLKIGVVE